MAFDDPQDGGATTMEGVSGSDAGAMSEARPVGSTTSAAETLAAGIPEGGKTAGDAALSLIDSVTADAVKSLPAVGENLENLDLSSLPVGAIFELELIHPNDGSSRTYRLTVQANRAFTIYRDPTAERRSSFNGANTLISGKGTSSNGDLRKGERVTLTVNGVREGEKENEQTEQFIRGNVGNMKLLSLPSVA